MSDQPPPLPPQPLEYQGNAPSGKRGHTAQIFFLAMIAGTAVSAAIWFTAFDPLVNHGSGWALVIVPAVKVVASIPLFFYPRLRAFAAGLLVSIPMGALMFFGSCMANFRYH